MLTEALVFSGAKDFAPSVVLSESQLQPSKNPVVIEINIGALVALYFSVIIQPSLKKALAGALNDLYQRQPMQGLALRSRFNYGPPWLARPTHVSPEKPHPS